MKRYRNYLIQLIFLIGSFQLCRLIFYLDNQDFLDTPILWEFIGGLRFDLAVISLLSLVPLILMLMPINFNIGIDKGLRFFFTAMMAVAIAMNLVDCGYYPFTLKRTSMDLFQIQGIGHDLLSLSGAFALDYWYLILLFACWLYGFSKLSSRLPLLLPKVEQKRKHLLLGLILLTGLILGTRGGVQRRPLAILNAQDYAHASNAALVLNTPFTFIKSINQATIEPLSYFNSNEIDSLYPLRQKFPYANSSDSSATNVCLIILESFGEDFFDSKSGKKLGLCPFLDSLMNESLRTDLALANGRMSIEALPSILAGIPSLLASPFVISPYAGNQINGLASILEKSHPNSSFFHGGQNGTMNFDLFAKKAGFKEYFGLNEYPFPEHYDGHWGIPDEPFLQWYAQKLNQSKKPFVSAVFTLSSHHPFKVPEEYAYLQAKGTQPIHGTIAYTDLAIRHFFDSIKTTSWFKNTLFVFVADHTSIGQSTSYNEPGGLYRIPLFFYGKGAPKKILTGLSQQIDISPTILDIIGYKGELNFFGRSILREPKNHEFCLNRIQNDYLYYDTKVWCRIVQDNIKEYFPMFPSDSVYTSSFRDSLAAKALLRYKIGRQQFNQRMLANSLIR